MEEIIMNVWEKYGRIYRVLDDDDRLNKCLNITPYEMMLIFPDEKISPKILPRINFLYEIIIALEGVYNPLGIYRWFHRKRVLLDNKSPIDILVGDWRPEDENPQKVLKLAERLLYGQIAS